VIRARREHKRDAGGSDESDERIELIAVVMANAIAGALLGTLDVWTRRGGGTPEDMTPLTIEAFAILQDLPLD